MAVLMANIKADYHVVIQTQVGSPTTLYATWEWLEDNTDHYNYQWWYCSDNKSSGNQWFIGEESTVTRKLCLYSYPSNATKVKFRVKAISKKYKKKEKGQEKEYSYWTAEWSSWVVFNINNSGTPEIPAVPTVTLDKYKLTCTVENNDEKTKYIEFYIINRSTGNHLVSRGEAVANKGHQATYTCDVDAGYTYAVKARGRNGSIYGQWSEYSSDIGTMPSTPTQSLSCKSTSETSVELNWEAVNAATSYTIEYALKESYFDRSPSNVSSITINAPTTSAEITGLDSGETWWFRLAATNSSGTSGFTEPVSVIVGKKPSAPTTWSQKSVLNLGDNAVLYWVHNSEDGSKEASAKLEITVDGQTSTVTVTKEQGQEENISSYTYSTSSLTSGKIISWRVCTKGVVDEYGDWSISREIKVYAPATLSFGDTIPERLTSYPLRVYVIAGPQEQSVVRFHVSVVAANGYETTDYDGTSKWVSAGDEIFSKNYDPVNNSRSLDILLTPADLTLANSESYQLKVLVSMDSGMNAETTAAFEIAWEDQNLWPNAEIAYNGELVSTSITPFCMGNVDSNLLDSSGNEIKDSSNSTITTLERNMSITDVTLSVYRREFDGTFTLVFGGLPGNQRTTITDPHPALDAARYRIVAISNSTGIMGFSDLTYDEINEVGTIIQWDEEWTSYDEDSPDDGTPEWSGTLLRLPYNVDIADSYSHDVELVEYIGRSHPVSYYGTQRGETSTWSMEIDREDTDTLFALRRLSIYSGDVYVRESSGSGYWASVKVSFTQTHCSVTIPVTLNVTRVEGGA